MQSTKRRLRSSGGQKGSEIQSKFVFFPKPDSLGKKKLSQHSLNLPAKNLPSKLTFPIWTLFVQGLQNFVPMVVFYPKRQITRNVLSCPPSSKHLSRKVKDVVTTLPSFFVKVDVCRKHCPHTHVLKVLHFLSRFFSEIWVAAEFSGNGVMEEKRLSIVYHLVSTNSEKVRVGSCFGGNVVKRLLKYKHESENGDDVVSQWIREVKFESSRLIPMHVEVCTKERIRRVEQEHIEAFGCELNPKRAYLSAEQRAAYNRAKAKEWASLHPESVREYAREYHKANRESLNEKKKGWRESNAEKVREARERLRPWNMEKVTCGCGDVASRCSMWYHIRSKSKKRTLSSLEVGLNPLVSNQEVHEKVTKEHSQSQHNGTIRRDAYSKTFAKYFK